MLQTKEQITDTYNFWQDSVTYHERDAHRHYKRSNILTLVGAAGVTLAIHNQLVGIPVAAVGFGCATQLHRAGRHAVNQALSAQRKTDLIEQQLGQSPTS